MQEDDFKNIKQLLGSPALDDDLNRLAEKEKEALLGDKEIKEKIDAAGLTPDDIDRNLGILLDFKADFEICRNCPGLEKCPKETPGYALEITKEKGYFERRHSPCRKVVARIKRDSRYLVCDFPEEWKDEVLSEKYPLVQKVISGEGIDENLKRVWKKGTREYALLSMAACKRTSKWFYLYGPFSIAKSNLVACMSNYFADVDGETIAFADTTKLIDRLRENSIKDKDSFALEMKKLSEVPIMVFDGFGNEFKSDFAFSTVLYPLLENRARSGKFTAFVSDFRWDEIGNMYATRVGGPRAEQLVRLLKYACAKEVKVDTLNVY